MALDELPLVSDRDSKADETRELASPREKRFRARSLLFRLREKKITRGTSS